MFNEVKDMKNKELIRNRIVERLKDLETNQRLDTEDKLNLRGVILAEELKNIGIDIMEEFNKAMY